MLFSSRLSLSNVIELCRVLRHSLGAGLMVRDVFRRQATNGPSAVRPVAGRIAGELERGGGLDDALKREEKVFPPLLIALARVGEQTGMLPEVFGELEKYFVRQQKLRWTFIGQIAWPIISFVLAVLAIAFLILVMGLIPPATDFTGKPYDPLGFGLKGPGGAMIFVGIVGGVLLGLFGIYLLVTRLLQQRAAFDSFCLRVPVLGPCARALALSRFCLALRLTLETAMPTGRALRLSLRATGNAAFEQKADVAVSAVKVGDELTVALRRTGVFPDDFLRILETAEESGRLHELLRQQGEYYDEESGRRLAILTGLAGYGVWLLVGGVIIFVIFRLFGAYLSLFDQLGV
jgi:type IV pilus assembly protein PilC